MGGSGVVDRVFAVVAAVVQSCVLQLLVSEHLVRCLHPPVHYLPHPATHIPSAAFLT